MKKQTVKPTAEAVAQFVEYVRGFYEIGYPGVLYPMATEAEIRSAVGALVEIAERAPWYTFEGDSSDREAVRTILEEYGCTEVAPVEPTSAAEMLGAFWDRVPLPSYAEMVAAATVAAVATVQRFEGDAVAFDEFPWLLELWPGRVDAIDTRDDVLGWL